MPLLPAHRTAQGILKMCWTAEIQIDETCSSSAPSDPLYHPTQT